MSVLTNKQIKALK